MEPTRGIDSAQLNYLQTVLGIREFIRPKALQKHYEVRLFALIPVGRADFPLQSEVSELIVKMIRAMKLERDEVISGEWICDSNAPVVPPPDQIRALLGRAVEASRPVVIFGLEGALSLLASSGGVVKPGDWVDIDGARAMVTHSPFELLASPAKKAQTWAHLQSLMKTL
jgi:hypothetical protein